MAYLPGLAIRRIADLYPGHANDDARDIHVIVLDVLIGFDDDLTGEATRIGNRIRGLLTSIHPAWSGRSVPRSTTRLC